MGCEFFPEPSGHALDCGAFETLDVVEVAVVELLEEGVHGVGDALVVIDPADPLIDGALDGNLDLEAVAVHASAFVILRQRREGVGGFEPEFLGESGFHVTGEG